MRPYTSAKLKPNLILSSSLALLLAALHTQPALALNGSSPSTGFAMVGQIVGGADGVLVAPNWVLTAGHAATTAKLFSSGYGSAMIDASFVLPGYQFPGNDLALLHLASPIIAEQYTALNLDYLDDSHLSQIGSVTLANASSNSQGAQWQNRYVESQLIDTRVWSGNYSVHWVIADKHPSGIPLLQSGDSGSGLFFSGDNESSLLGGIASAICLTNKSCFVQPTAYRDWLDITLLRYVPADAEEARRQQLNWVSMENIADLSLASANITSTPGMLYGNTLITAVPEPGKMTMMLLGALLLALRPAAARLQARRRRQ